jgi:hypothetical protein
MRIPLPTYWRRLTTRERTLTIRRDRPSFPRYTVPEKDNHGKPAGTFVVKEGTRTRAFLPGED